MVVYDTKGALVSIRPVSGVNGKRQLPRTLDHVPRPTNGVVTLILVLALRASVVVVE